MLYRWEGEPPPVDEIPDDYSFPPMGTAEEVRACVTSVLPSVDWSDPAWGVLEGDGYSIEFNLQESGEVDGFMLHVRGGGDPVSAIAGLCKAHRWVALDTSTGEFLDVNAPSHAGWADFQAFRDRVVESLGGERHVPWYKRLWRR